MLPDDTECTFLYMKKDDKQSIEAVDVDGGITSYTLELSSVDVRRTKGPEKAKSSKSRARPPARREPVAPAPGREQLPGARALGPVTGRFVEGAGQWPRLGSPFKTGSEGIGQSRSIGP